MVKTKLHIEKARSFKTCLMKSNAGHICLVVDNTEEIRVMILGRIDSEGCFLQDQVGANYTVKNLDCFSEIEDGSFVTITA